MQGDGRPRRAARAQGPRAGGGLRALSGSSARIRRVELRSSDPEASAAFYCRLLGLEVASSNAGRIALRIPGAAEELLVLRRSARAGPPPQAASGLFHVAFLYPDRAGLAAALRRLTGELQARFTGASDHGVSEALYLDDPDGLGVEIYRDRPRSEWPAAEEGSGARVGMFTRPLEVGDLLAADERESATETAARGIGIGHVHLKVADPGEAAAFWTGAGMDLTLMFGPHAAFLAYDDYHHHIGANSWFSANCGPAPREFPGIEAIALRAPLEGGEATTPEGIAVLGEPDAA